MFREMRRNDKARSKEDTVRMLSEASFGTLAINSIDGYPYSVPVSYSYVDDKIYFHGAKSGLKYESLQDGGRVSFSVVLADDVQPDKFTTLYRSAIIYGNCREVTDGDELKKAYDTIIDKYSKGFEKEGMDYIREHGAATVVFCIDIEHMTGKGMG